MRRTRMAAMIVTALDQSELVASLGVGCPRYFAGSKSRTTEPFAARPEHPVQTKRRISTWKGTLHFSIGATKLFASGLTGGVYSLR
jgi:hypothetical protein